MSPSCPVVWKTVREPLRPAGRAAPAPRWLLTTVSRLVLALLAASARDRHAYTAQ
jgi:hypothetical protein